MLPLGTVLLHDNRPDGSSLLFEGAREILTTRRKEDALPLLRSIASAQAEGFHVAGFLSYELGLLFEERLSPLLPEEVGFPLLWFGIFGEPARLSQKEAADWLDSHAGEEATLSEVAFSLSREAYGTAFRRLKDYIAAGDVYQVNLTLRQRFSFSGDPVALYRRLCRSQPVGHGALIATGEHHILSLSPELFIERRGDEIRTRPMKGTAPRGRFPEEDREIAEALLASEKAQAENLMIVDLLRNDLSRIALPGSVAVPRLFDTETYRSFHTLTSTVSGRLVPETGLDAILPALFPCGSVTGAPKIRAMEIIKELETGPRWLYCGSIGHVAPDGDFSFNVAIRTATIDRNGRGEIGTGGGIVADSDEEAEYREALLKLRFLEEPGGPFGLIETLLWDGRQFILLDRHLGRLARSASHFGFVHDSENVRRALDEAVSGRSVPLRVRLVLGEDGITTGATPLAPMHGLRFTLAGERVNSADALLFHKTTRRDFYDRTRAAEAAAHGVDETVFLNERGELTEGSFTNLFLRSSGRLLTPALSCGLLPGTLREELLATGKVEEAVLTISDLEAAEAIFLGNSVRDLLPATWVRT